MARRRKRRRRGASAGRLTVLRVLRSSLILLGVIFIGMTGWVAWHGGIDLDSPLYPTWEASTNWFESAWPLASSQPAGTLPRLSSPTHEIEPATNQPPPTPVGGAASLSPPSVAMIETGTHKAQAGVRTFEQVLEAQVALARRGLSPGSVDGVWGAQTRGAVRAFQAQQGLSLTGELDAPTLFRLKLTRPVFKGRIVRVEDLSRLQPLSTTWLGKSQQTALEFETLLELVAEESRSHPQLIERLNPQISWTQVSVGTPLKVPDTTPDSPTVSAAFLRIGLADRTLEVFDVQTNLLAHYPCSIGRVAEKRPTGLLYVEVCIPHPNYTFDPAIFSDSPEARTLGRKVVVPPGPNNPVGTVWIGLDRPSYGIHGTPVPEKVGRTESRGCFRLANWNAMHLLQYARVGMPVHVEP